jgi:hypothetical protein
MKFACLNPSLFPLATAGLALTALSALANAQTDRLLDKALETLSLERASIIQLEVNPEIGAPQFIPIEIEGREHLLQLDAFSVRTSGYQLLAAREDGQLQPVQPGPERTMRGQLVGALGTRASGTLCDDGLYAAIRLQSGDSYWLQPLQTHVPEASSDTYILYQGGDVRMTGHVCGSESLTGAFSTPQQQVGETFGGGGLKVAELACDADYEYFQDYGSVNGVETRINALINTMNDQYESEVGIQHQISTIIVRSSSSDPYTSNDAVTLLNQFRSQWLSSHGGVQRDVAHLFTGRSISGGTIGIAWLGVICNQNYGYGLVESDFNGVFSSATDLSAHELGHNWNADHCSCTSHTMNPYITSSNTFNSTLTRPVIRNHRDSRGCLSDGGGGGGGGDPVVLFADGFDMGNFTAGGWTVSSGKPRVKPNAKHDGSHGARLRHTGYIERAIPTSGYSTVVLDYWRRSRNFDSGEGLTVEWFDGFLWNTVETVTTKAWGHTQVVLPILAGDNPNFKLRFRTNANQNRERGDVDTIQVIGTP